MRESASTTARTMAMAGIAIVILLSVTGVAYDNPLNVIFKAQYPPGDWNFTQNCGQASVLMVFSYHNGTIPTEQGIKDIDIWLNNTYGKKQPIDNYNGTATTSAQLEALAKDYAGFTDSYNANKWKINDLKREIDAGHPIIVLVNGSFLSQTYRKHYVVVKGYNDTHIIINDPGKTKGDGRAFANANFTAAMNDQKGVVMVMPKTSPIPPNQKLTVLSPNGDESWPAGSEQKIQWKFTGKPITSVNIELQKGVLLTEPVAYFAPTNYSGDGSYLWTIPTDQNTGTDYKIIVTSAVKSKNTDASDGYFTISAPTPTPIPTPSPTPTPTPTPIPIGSIHNVNKNTNYTVIQTAIDDANTGDEIHVYSGTYPENVNMNKQLVLIGVNTDGSKPIIDSGAANDAILLEVDGITFDGFKIRTKPSPYRGINVVSNNNIIANNDVKFNDNSGICLSSSSNNTLIGNNVSNNGNGIYLMLSDNNTLVGNNASNNFDGIHMYSSKNNTLAENTVSNNNGYGIFLYICGNNKFYHNNFVNNTVQAYFF